jgi:hypothetical protein
MAISLSCPITYELKPRRRDLFTIRETEVNKSSIFLLVKILLVMQKQAIRILVIDKKQWALHFWKRESIAVMQLIDGYEKVAIPTTGNSKNFLKSIIREERNEFFALKSR